jgi:hypothetical protein
VVISGGIRPTDNLSKETSKVQEEESEEKVVHKPEFSKGIGDSLDPQLEIARWQMSIEEMNLTENLTVALFNACTRVVPLVLRILSEQPENKKISTYQNFREEFRKFYVWNDIFPTVSGELDKILSSSRNLKITALDLLAQWGRLVCRGTTMGWKF